jgi:hypothetical protein
MACRLTWRYLLLAHFQGDLVDLAGWYRRVAPEETIQDLQLVLPARRLAANGLLDAPLGSLWTVQAFRDHSAGRAGRQRATVLV